jgi:uncharacterized membrane protein YbhN (UPF0104 family)
VRRLALPLRILISAAILAVVVSRLDAERLREAAARSNPLFLAAAASLAAAFTGLKVLRWRFLASHAGSPLGAADAFRSYLGGIAVGVLTPGRFGELARSLYLGKEKRLAYTMLALADKVLDVWAILACAIAGALVLLGPLAGALAAAGTVGLALAMLFAPRLASHVPARIRPALEAVSFLGTGTILRAEALAVFTFGLVLVEFHALGNAFQEVPFAAAFHVLPLVVLSNLIPLSIAGLGIREGTAVLLFSGYGVGAETAVTISLLLFLLNTGIPALVGMVLTRGLRAGGARRDSGSGGGPGAMPESGAASGALPPRSDSPPRRARA